MSTDSNMAIDLAWQRVRSGAAGRGFIKHPFELYLVETDLRNWLDKILSEITNGLYQPSTISIANVPKGKGAVRPGAWMALRDRLVYTACIGTILPEIRRALSWHDRTIDFSYPLSRNDTDVRWIVDDFKAWQRFREASIAFLTGKAYVVLADITGYYENVDLATLSSDLRTAGAKDETMHLLTTCLNRWAQVTGRGIPQGLAASDILGKLYLNAVDRLLYQQGYLHVRYVDDIRIFCSDNSEAKRALMELSEFLRRRGLNIQSAKSVIRRADDARLEIDGITPILEDVRKRYIADLSELLGVEGYVAPHTMEAMLTQEDGETPIEVLRETYKAYFIDADPYKFDKTLFRFLVKRLGKAKDRFALDHCRTILERQPQETESVLAYAKAIGAANDIEPTLAMFVESKDAVYDYQLYQIFEWVTDVLKPPGHSLVQSARVRAFDGHHPQYLRVICKKLLAEHGNSTDLERLEHSYANTNSAFEQAEIMCCLRKMERVRRNAFLKRAEGDGEWNRAAAQWVREQKSDPIMV
ncbi:MAG TPA: RNA-directed DNA polymerase [Tepidisphaeraceae bacterium]|jgi:hypothetical protein|nr:RNA-directed DNA polymerase [Tepidisphaeraceae bacterium]